MKHRFAVLSILVFGLMCLHTRNGVWIGDFWDHSAVVRELSTHLLHPKHPHLFLDAPHNLYSPYAVAIAFLSRVMHLDAITILSIAGLVNLGILLLGLRMFVFAVVPKLTDATALYTLFLLLFGWGINAWLFSGFFHIGVLGYVLPYPSTFAMGLSLIALSLDRRRIDRKHNALLVPIFLIAVIVLITHPLTFLFLATGLLSFSINPQGLARRDAALVILLLGLSFLCASFWPYFPFLNLITGGGDVYHAPNRAMYDHVLIRLGPSLLAIPWVIATMRSNSRSPLGLMLLMLSALYAYGAFSGKYTYGRVISYIALLLQLTLAERLALWESELGKSSVPLWRGRLQRLAVPVSVAVICLFFTWQPFKNAWSESLPQRQPAYESYRFLSRFTGQYDVVLSDLETSWRVPTFGGKVVAALHPHAFVPDNNVRWSDLDQFFSGHATAQDRQRIIEKYGAKYLLLNRETVSDWPELKRSFAPLGQVVYEDGSFVLISLTGGGLTERREFPE